jgi:hypothetical protein
MNFNGSYFIQEKGELIDLWNPNIEWHNCPKELASAVILVEHARQPDMMELHQYASDCVHVSGHYVVASDGSRVCRSRLPIPVPFDMAIYHVEPSTPHETQGQSLFSILDYKKCVLSRVAKLDIFGEIFGGYGLAFDFGDRRAWCLSKPNDFKPDFVKKVNPFFKGKVTKILNEVTDEVNHMAQRFYEYAFAEYYCGEYYPMTVTINDGKIHFLVETEKDTFEDEESLNTECYVQSMTFEIDAIHFAEAVNGWCSMGIIRNDKLNDIALYFKETKYNCEHIVGCKCIDLKE